jgi:hypothetical protein
MNSERIAQAIKAKLIEISNNGLVPIENISEEAIVEIINNDGINLNELQRKITYIKDSLRKNGTFKINDLDGGTPPDISIDNELIHYIEEFNIDNVTVNVFDSTSPDTDVIDTYIMMYEDLEEDEIDQIVFLCDQWESENS